MEDFLPKGYEIPEAPSKYMRFQKGTNRFRFLDRPILGNEYWNHDNKPVRKRLNEKVNIDDIRPEQDGSTKIHHFWAMPVWNYESQSVQVLQVNQKSVQKALQSYIQDEDWGNPTAYDVVVEKTGEKLTTEYEVKAKPAKALDPAAAKAWEDAKEANFNIGRMYGGGDPFVQPKDGDRETPPEADAEGPDLSDIPF